MKMTQYSVRVDQKLADILEKNSEHQGIKMTRYIRSLLEKGLVIDTLVQQGSLAEKQDNSKSHFEIRIAELVAQNLVLGRKLIRAQSKTEDQANKEISEAETLAREYISKLINNQGDL
jgi:hypothetical protein